jgi:hypothetical protein
MENKWFKVPESCKEHDYIQRESPYQGIVLNEDSQSIILGCTKCRDARILTMCGRGGGGGVEKVKE